MWLLPWFLTVVIVLSLYFEVLFFNYTVFHQENLSPESSGLEQLLLCTLTKNRGGMIIDKITIRKLFHVGKLLFVMVRYLKKNKVFKKKGFRLGAGFAP